MRAMFLLLFALAAAACDPIPVHYACDLPRLHTDLPQRSLAAVSTFSYFSNECPFAIATKLEIQRDYGDIRLEWWGDPHRLYMKAIAKNGELLQLSGEGIKQRYETFLSEDYTARKTFHRPNFIDKPIATSFDVEVRESSGDLLEIIRLRYDTLNCTCVAYDSI